MLILVTLGPPCTLCVSASSRPSTSHYLCGLIARFLSHMAPSTLRRHPVHGLGGLHHKQKRRRAVHPKVDHLPSSRLIYALYFDFFWFHWFVCLYVFLVSISLTFKSAGFFRVLAFVFYLPLYHTYHITLCLDLSSLFILYISRSFWFIVSFCSW